MFCLGFEHGTTGGEDEDEPTELWQYKHEFTCRRIGTLAR